MSITSRILLAFAAIAGLAFYFLLDPIIERVERQYLEAAEEPMVDIANVLAAVAEDTWKPSPDFTKIDLAFRRAKARVLRAQIYNLTKTTMDLDAYITDTQGTVLWHSSRPEIVGTDYSRYFDIYFTLRGRYGARSSRVDENDPTSSIMHVGAPIIVDGQIAGVLTVCKPQQSMAAFIDETRNLLKLFGAVALAGVLAAGLLIARWITRPLRRLTDYALAIAKGNRPPAPSVHTSDARTLASAFEEMRDALEDRKYVESYVQTLTHEIKSPVAAIRGAAELLEADLPREKRERFVGNIIKESARLEHFADGLLRLANVESMKNLKTRSRVDLSSIAERAAAIHQSACESRQIRIEYGADGGSHEVLGDPILLELALSNLVQNAIAFAPDNSTVNVRVTAEGSDVVVRVIDEGPGLPEYAEDKVFERFYSLPRPDTGRKSSGLGLCFVREAATLHQGTATLANRKGARGACAELRIPARNLN